ncbi:polysaccharide biosynthesis protein [Viridibacillus sp. YIM B01967]|uniref:Polysaccharide biosynthesis protein n=1 Tax=Viridibacillus soli TaxID=2798301 RepID=A0ABS1HC63_9BACL|nr:polysaccharide biosynthesis protein [Viridibacillus soli]MBK3496911.1 polysaccharide biosynthesis protein [Viridibacillus soli]
MPEKWGMKVYVKGVALLTLAALFVKILSMLYRVPFQNLVGDQGFYIYQQVYPFVAIFVVWTSSGFAVAISKMLAEAEERDGEAQRHELLRVTFYYLSILSILFFAILFGGADLFAKWMGDPALALLLRTGSFVTLCMPAIAVYKGLFQARGIMTPVAYAQVIEQTVRVLVILGGTWIVMATTSSLYQAGQIAMAGTVVGELAGIILLWLYFKKYKQKKSVVVRKKIAIFPVIKELTILSIAVSMSGLLLLFFQLVDSFTVFETLVKGGIPIVEAMETKGIYDRGQPLVQVGLVIATSLSLAIVPLVAHASKKHGGRDAERFIQLTYRTALLFGFAATLGLMLVMPYVNEMLFETRELSNVLIIFVIQIVWLSLILPLTAMLQGLGKLKVPALLLTAGFLVKVVCNEPFIAKWGIIGAAYAGNLGLIFSAFGLIYYFKKIRPIRLAPMHFYMGTSLASLAMIGSVLFWIYCAEQWFSSSLPSRLQAAVTGSSAAAIGAFVFLTFIAKLGVLSSRDWFLLPFGRRMASYQLWLQRKK